MNKYPKKDLKLYVWKFKTILLFQLQSLASWSPIHDFDLRCTCFSQVIEGLTALKGISSAPFVCTGHIYRSDEGVRCSLIMQNQASWVVRQVKALPCDRLVLLWGALPLWPYATPLGDGGAEGGERALCTLHFLGQKWWLSLVAALYSLTPLGVNPAFCPPVFFCRCSSGYYGQQPRMPGGTCQRVWLPCMAPSQAVTVGPGSVSAGGGHKGSLRGVWTEGTFWWSDCVCECHPSEGLRRVSFLGWFPGAQWCLQAKLKGLVALRHVDLSSLQGLNLPSPALQGGFLA